MSAAPITIRHPAIAREMLLAAIEAAECDSARTAEVEGCNGCSAYSGQDCEDDCGRPGLWEACVVLRHMFGLPPLPTYEVEHAEALAAWMAHQDAAAQPLDDGSGS